jgi:hypothetical protein
VEYVDLVNSHVQIRDKLEFAGVGSEALRYRELYWYITL